jgi:hypothetical protein
MKYKNLIFILIVFISFIFIFDSCKKTKYSDHLEVIAKEYIGKQIIFPENIYNDYIKYNKNKYILISYIDSSKCTRCELENIKQYMLHDFSKVSTENILIINSQEETKIKDILSELYIDYPVFFDKTGELKKENKFLNEDLFQYFVIDKDMNIIWLGSPILSKESWILYNKLINKLK